jgi:hypothetical protein
MISSRVESHSRLTLIITSLSFKLMRAGIVSSFAAYV